MMIMDNGKLMTKLFDPFNSVGCDRNVELDDAINDFLITNNVTLVDVKYQHNYTPAVESQGWLPEPTHTALLIYKEAPL